MMNFDSKNFFVYQCWTDEKLYKSGLSYKEAMDAMDELNRLIESGCCGDGCACYGSTDCFDDLWVAIRLGLVDCGHTIVEDGKTIRLWTESRGSKTLVRIFELQYRVNAYLNGRWGSKICGTLKEAKGCMDTWQFAIAKKYGVREWRKDNGQVLTHVDGTAFYAIVKMNTAKCFITEEAALKPCIAEFLKD